ncbi:MAG TPA: hypothetical protein VHC97_04325 [Thermoanaerobaculia bacterium]|jgi:hypothetical protein|nr:hypothetical protein [Thermoanaerobaculia bacterium]
MDKTRFALFLVLTSAWLGAAGHPARAAQLVALTPEEELYADIFANSPVVAAQPDGPYVIAWDDDTFSNIEGSFSYRYTPAGEDIGTGVYDSIYSPTGAPAVDAVTAGRQGFDVFWHTVQYEDEPTLFYRAHLNLRGMTVGKPVRLGGVGTEWVWQVRGNGFMAGWSLPSKHGIAARRLAASGQRMGPELRLNSRPVDHLAGVSVVGLADAGFVAVWLGSTPGSTGTAVLRARRFSPSGKPLGPDFDINTIPLGRLDTPSDFGPGLKVAAAPGGGFVVAWTLSQGVYLRWFNASGTPLGPERVASAPGDSAAFPESMAFDDTGNLLLLLNLDYSALQLRLFDPQGTPQGSPVDVNSDDTEEPWGGSLAWTGDSWLVAWVAAIFPYDQSSIFVRRFAKR